MNHIQQNAEDAVRNMLVSLSEREGLEEVGVLKANDFLDEGSEIILQIINSLIFFLSFA